MMKLRLRARLGRGSTVRLGAALSVAALALAACGQGASQTASGSGGKSDGGKPTITLATGGAQPPNEMEAAIFAKELADKGVLPNYGKKYDLKIVQTKGTPEAQSLLVAGQANFATLAFSTIATAVSRNAVPGGFSIVAGHYVAGQEGSFANTYMVLANSGIRSAADLKGKTVGVNAVGTAVDVILRVWLKDNGVDPEKDVKFAEIPFPAMDAALRAGRIQLGAFTQPFAALATSKEGLTSLFTSKDAIGENAAIALVAQKSFLKDNGEAARAFLSDWVAGLQWLSDSKNRAEAIEIMARVSGSPAGNLDLFYSKQGADYYRDPNACPNATALQAGVEGMVKTGYLPKSVKIADLVDTSYLPKSCPKS
jgi:NitT/TauT family transport system substrate-binding protein